MEGLLTIILAVMSGVVVFVFCEYLKEILIEPLQNYKKLKADISYVLTMYSNLLHNPIRLEDVIGEMPQEYQKGSSELRMMAAKLNAFIETVSWFRLGIPTNKVLYEVSKNFIGLSNTLFVPKGLAVGLYINTNIENLKSVKEKIKLRNVNK